MIALLFLAVQSSGFVERDGVVSIEAENAAVVRNGWTPIEGTSGRAMRDDPKKGSGYLAYPVLFRKPGKYTVWLLCRDEGNSETNDCFVTLNGKRLYGSDDKTRPEGIRVNGDSFRWSALPKGPGGHTPNAIRNDPVYALVPRPGRYLLKIASRSKGFAVDKIVLTLEGTAPPEGKGPEETRPARRR